MSRRSSHAHGSTNGTSRRGLRNHCISQSKAGAGRPSTRGRDAEKLAHVTSVEHRQLKAGVRRLRVSECNPRPSFFFGVNADENRNGEILDVATFSPFDSTVRKRRAQAAINKWALDVAKQLARDYPEEVAAVERVRAFMRKRIAGETAQVPADDVLFTFALIIGAIERDLGPVGMLGPWFAPAMKLPSASDFWERSFPKSVTVHIATA